MCGRYSLAVPQAELVEAFAVPPLTFDYAPRYNIAPGQDAPVVASDRLGRRAGLMGWGLVPSWADEPARPFVNARGESISSTPSFRDAFRSRRCLVPADGFYEWRGEAAPKVPHWFHPSGGGVLALGGIWETWSPPGREPHHGFAILTVEASEDVKAVHHRMPLLLEPAVWELWLQRDASLSEVTKLVVPAPAGTLRCHEVSPRVNRTAHDDPELVEPV